MVSINGDAFSTEIKDKAIALIRKELGQVDLVVYSLAAPRRTHPVSGVTHKSTLKPIGKRVEERTLDTDRKEIKQVALDAASEEEIADTVVDARPGRPILVRDVASVAIGPALRRGEGSYAARHRR